MKLKRKICLVIVIVFVFLIGITYSIIPKFRYYNSVEDAVNQDRIFNGSEYLGQLESNDICKVLYNKKGDSIYSQYLVKEERKWKVIDVQDFFILKRSELNATVNYYKIGEKHIISISDLSIQGEVKDVHDSVSSNFAYFQYDFPETYGQTTSVVEWMVVFDALPENYSITVDGETVAID